MEALALIAIVLICPITMGAMMLWMHRRNRR